MGAKKGGKLKGALSKVKSAIGGKLAKFKGKGKAIGKRRRSKGPSYWANKVLVEKLKKRYWKLRYGGR